MKRLIGIAIAVLILGTTSSYGLVIGQMRTAETSGWGSFNVTTGVGLLEDYTHLFGTVRYGLASQIDASGSIALVDADGTSDASLLFNADVQYQFMQSKLGWTFDMAGGVVFEYVKLGFGNYDFSTWSLGVTYVISKPVKMNNGFTFTPYGRVNLRSDNYNADYDGGIVLDKATPRFGKVRAFGDSGDDSDFNIGVNAGSVFPISSKINLIGELVIDDEIGFIGGINFFMW